jgi:gas vesicle protein
MEVKFYLENIGEMIKKRIKECLDEVDNTKQELLKRLTQSQEKVVEEYKFKLIE